MITPPASPRAPVDVAADACRRFATHLGLLACQLGEAAMETGEQERLVAALDAVELAVAKVAAAAGARVPRDTGQDDHGA